MYISIEVFRETENEWLNQRTLPSVFFGGNFENLIAFSFWLKKVARLNDNNITITLQICSIFFVRNKHNYATLYLTAIFLEHTGCIQF